MAFITEMVAQGRSKQGITGLKSRLPHFLEFLDQMQIESSEITLQTAYDYQLYIINRGRSDGTPYRPNTIRSYIIAASTYTNWLVSNHVLSSNPFSSIRKVPQETILPRNLVNEEFMEVLLDHMMDFLSPDTIKRRILRYRTHLMAEVLYGTAIRLSELGDLQMEDVDLQRRILHIRSGKGGRSRYAYLNEYAASLLELYIKRLRPLIIHFYPQVDPQRLFLSCGGTLVHSLNGELQKCAHEALDPEEGATVSDGVSAHWIRHCVGYHLLRSGCSLRYIQQILGHVHIHTSEIYTKVDGERLEEMLLSCHPRSRILNVA